MRACGCECTRARTQPSGTVFFGGGSQGRRGARGWARRSALATQTGARSGPGVGGPQADPVPRHYTPLRLARPGRARPGRARPAGPRPGRARPGLPYEAAATMLMPAGGAAGYTRDIGDGSPPAAGPRPPAAAVARRSTRAAGLPDPAATLLAPGACRRGSLPARRRDANCAAAVLGAQGRRASSRGALAAAAERSKAAAGIPQLGRSRSGTESESPTAGVWSGFCAGSQSPHVSIAAWLVGGPAPSRWSRLLAGAAEDHEKIRTREAVQNLQLIFGNKQIFGVFDTLSLKMYLMLDSCFKFGLWGLISSIQNPRPDICVGLCRNSRPPTRKEREPTRF